MGVIASYLVAVKAFMIGTAIGAGAVLVQKRREAENARRQR
ncbi:MAG: hypothetical protein QNJ30_20290 [Kiloniellales bacterium]|nr:hypothetical protein [Kiloniellales bacterium]